MRVVCTTQRTTEWFEARLGKQTASNSNCSRSRFAVKKDGTPRKDGETRERENYKFQLVAERLAGRVTGGFVSVWMNEGAEGEETARTAYGVRFDVDVAQTGFVLHPSYDFFGASPDGILPDGGVLEIKIPKTANHLKYIDGKLDPWEEYGDQLLGEFICCCAPYVEFMSYSKDLPEHLSIFTRRYVPNVKQVGDYESDIASFDAEVGDLVARYNGKRDFIQQLHASLAITAEDCK